MKSQIVRIGNSRGIRIPKLLLEQAGLGSTVEITVENDALVIRPARKPRDGWPDAFRGMAERSDDTPLDDMPTPTAWDRDEWKWR